jgi:hypothetical protein
MVRYELECPACGMREALDRVDPGARRRCASCRKIMTVPGPEEERRELDPEIRRRLVRALALRRIALVAALMLVVLSVGTAALLDARAAKRDAPAGKDEPPPRLGVDTLDGILHRLAMPLSRGRRWTYALSGGGEEERRVGLVSNAPGEGVEAVLAVTGSSDQGLRTYRILPDGVWLVSEQRTDGRWSFAPPLKAVPHPLYAEDRWTMHGTATGPRGAKEVWRLDCGVSAVENVETPAGRFPCYRVEVKGMKGASPVEETLWLAKGTGLVRRRSIVDGRTEEARLLK